MEIIPQKHRFLGLWRWVKDSYHEVQCMYVLQLSRHLELVNIIIYCHIQSISYYIVSCLPSLVPFVYRDCSAIAGTMG